MTQLAFLGSGIMGLPMSLNLLAAGYRLAVYNRTAEKAHRAVAAGATHAQTPRAAAEGAEAVIVMVTGPEAVDELLAGPDGVLAGLAPGAALVNMSTVSPAYARSLGARLAAEGIPYLDAPVSGSKKPAEEGTLVVLAGGEGELIERLEPMFLALGKRVVACGDVGRGSEMKMAVNLLLGIMMGGLCEALEFGAACGIDRELLLETFLAGPLNCGLFELKREMLLAGDYPPQFPYKHMTKDIRFALQTADAAGAAVPLGHALFQLYREGIGRGLGDADLAALQRVLRLRGDAAQRTKE